MQTIVRIKFGSHLYGTSTPESDTDYMSVHLPSAREILLQQVADSLGNDRKNARGQKNAPTDTDDESYSLQRYLQLLAEGQTVALDMLFAPSLELASPLWRTIQANKDKLITKKSAAFVGYCRTQANKYGIKGSRVAAARAAMEFFEHAVRQSFTPSTDQVLRYAESLKVLCTDEHTKIVEQNTYFPDGSGKEERFFECCNRKVPFKASIKTAYEMYKHVFDEYGARALAAEKGEGVDWKALSHAVRVGHEALELLQTGLITFPLPNAADVLHIKQGKVVYPVVAQMIEDLLVRVEAAEKISVLRTEPDWEWINGLVAWEYGTLAHDWVAERVRIAAGRSVTVADRLALKGRL
jgi:hypothetical protein